MLITRDSVLLADFHARSKLPPQAHWKAPGFSQELSVSLDILTHLPVVHLRRHCVGHNDVRSQVLLDQMRVQVVVGVRSFT